MSHNYSYRSSKDDYRSRQDMDSDSYQRESDFYRQRSKSSSQELMHSAASSSKAVDTPVLMSGKVLSFLQSCGLDASDLSLLAEIPDHLITVETLPKQLLQIKERKLSSTSSSRSSTTTTQPSTATHTWKGGNHINPVESPLDRLAHPNDPLPPEHVESWQDRWGNVRKTGSEINTSISTTSKASTVVDYSHSSGGKSYYDKESYTSMASDSLSSTFSHTYDDYNKRQEPLPLVSSDTLFEVPSRKEASDFHGILPPVFPYACVLCNSTAFHDKDWSVHLRSTQHSHNKFELVKRYPQWDQNLESAKRNESHSTLQPKSKKNRSPYIENVPSWKEAAHFQGRIPPVFPYMCVLCDITIRSARDWSVHIESGLHARRQQRLLQMYPEWDQTIASTRRDESQVTTQKKYLEKTDTLHRVPTRKEASDFYGKVPPVFPYSCALCDITVLSKKDWSLHTTGAQHANSQLMLVEKYPEWDQLIKSARRNECYVTQQTESRGGMEDNKRKTSNKKKISSTKTSIKNHFSRVVSFCPLPAGEGTTSELIAIAKRFGCVKNSLFLPSRGYVEMTDLADAKKLVQYYSSKLLKLKRKAIQVTFSTEYDTLKETQVNEKPEALKSYPQRTSSPRRHSAQTDSPSPKRRCSEERSCSSRSSRSKERDDRQQSQERSNDWSKKPQVSSHSSPKNETTKSQSEENEDVATMDSDCDLEGLEVIGDDEEYLLHDDDEPEDDQTVHQEQKTCEETTKLNDQSSASAAISEHNESSGGEEAKNLTDQSQDSGKVHVPNVHSKAQEKTLVDASNADILITSDSLKDQNPEEQKDEVLETDEDDTDFPEGFENFITLDELVEDTNYKESSEESSSKEKTEDKLDETNVIINGQIPLSCEVSEGNKKQIESSKEENTESPTAETLSSEEDLLKNAFPQSVELQDQENNTPIEQCTEQHDGEKDIKGIQESTDDKIVAETSPSVEPKKREEPVGTEFVRPVVGYFCNLCNVIYSSEEEAKDEHCRTPSHHEKFREHMEKIASS
ncbi:matrin 3-like 1.1 [Hoplias malabaricus]|uniref:matrin 3-like 1.1 n=1 Tax=Hoplias malabaricus TaxID=27720 RepID=UPI003461CC88